MGRYAYAPMVITRLLSLFSYHINDSNQFLLKLVLNRRSCDSWIKLSKHSTVIDLSRASTYRLSNTIVTLCHPGRHRTCSRSHQYSITSTYVCRVSQDTRDPYKIQTDVFSREKVLLTRVQSIFNTLLKIASISGSIRG